MTINWARLVLAVALCGMVFTEPNEVSYEMVRLFKLFYFLFSILMFGLVFGVKEV